MKKIRYLSGAFACAITLFPFQSFSADKYWDCGSDAWDQDSCWSPSGQPVTGDSAFLTQSDSTNRVVTYANAISPTPVLNSLTVDATGNGIMDFLLGQDALQADTEYIGYDGIGIVNQTGGTNTLGSYPSGSLASMYIGYNSTAIGTYNLYSGQLSTPTGDPSADIYVGYDGIGIFNNYGGGGGGPDMYVGYNANSIGTYNLFDGDGNYTNLYVGTYDGIGTFNQYGGNESPSGASIGTNGTYNQYDGRFVVDGLGISGTYNQFNGTFFASMGLSSGGEYNLIGGSFGAGGGVYGNSVPVWGTFNQSGGDSSLLGTMDLRGTYNLTGGELGAPSIVLGTDGRFNFNGGTLSVDDFSGDLENHGGTLVAQTRMALT